MTARDRTAARRTAADALEAKLRAAARDVYQAVGSDVWGGDCTDEDEFVDVIRDQLAHEPDAGRTDLTEDDVAAFSALPFAEKRRIILTAM